MHYGLLLPAPTAGIFAINEVPDLAGKIQVALFNIMQEGDIQIKGYPVRLELDVAIVFSANPEDLHRPRQNRHPSQRPHRLRKFAPTTPSPSTKASPSPSRKPGPPRSYATDQTIQQIEIPHYIRQIVETIAFTAREDKKSRQAFRRLSQRLPISTMELVLSNAERAAH